MRSDMLPVTQWIADFTRIRQSKSEPRKNILRRIAPAIERRYFTYCLLRNSLETVAKKRIWPGMVKEALQHCYSGKSAAWTKIRDDHKDAVAPRPFLCPYCLMRDPTTLDHFLPQGDFPEYAVLPANLVWVCYSCNLKKSDRLVTGVRDVLNPYFDPIPKTDPILFASIAVSVGQGPVIRFWIDTYLDDVTDAFLALARRHLDAFRLVPAYTLSASALMDGIISEIVRNNLIAIDQTSLTAILEGRYEQFATYPANSWEKALLDAMRACPDLLTYINALIPSAQRLPLPPPRTQRGNLRSAARAAATGFAAA